MVAEGIETEAEAVTVLELGADLLQGFFLGRPGAATAFDNGGFERAAGCIEPLARAFKSHMVGQINARKLEYRRFNLILNRILCDLTGATRQDFDVILGRLVGEYPKLDCLYVLDDGGVQVTETICGAGLVERPGGAMFRPAPLGTDHSLKEYFYVLMDVELQKYTTDPVRLAGQRAALPHHQHLLSRRRQRPDLRALRRRPGVRCGTPRRVPRTSAASRRRR